MAACSLDERRRLDRGQAAGVRVPEHLALQQLRVCGDLRLGVEAAACVIQVDVIVRVQPPVLRRAQVIEHPELVIGNYRLRLELTWHISIMAGRRSAVLDDRDRLAASRPERLRSVGTSPVRFRFGCGSHPTMDRTSHRNRSLETQTLSRLSSQQRPRWGARYESTGFAHSGEDRGPISRNIRRCSGRRSAMADRTARGGRRRRVPGWKALPAITGFGHFYASEFFSV